MGDWRGAGGPNRAAWEWTRSAGRWACRKPDRRSGAGKDWSSAGRGRLCAGWAEMAVQHQTARMGGQVMGWRVLAGGDADSKTLGTRSASHGARRCTA